MVAATPCSPASAGARHGIAATALGGVERLVGAAQQVVGALFGARAFECRRPVSGVHKRDRRRSPGAELPHDLSAYVSRRSRDQDLRGHE
ncbi:MAG: hypothetical protein WCP98_11840 [Actinomycetes bacterium]